MYENDGGKEERELVLGNKQLLGIFFVATLLCGIFFAMGYVVGGNSAKAGAAAAATAPDGAPAAATDGKREEPQAPPGANTSNDTASATPPSGYMGSPLPAAEPRVADNPAAAGAQPPSVPAPREATPTAPALPAKKPTAEAAAPAPAAVYVSVPEKGTSYWQVTAVGRPAADVLVTSLRERQLPAILAESSNPKLFRVLVGPYRSQPALADAKRKLTDLSFDALIIQKY